MIGIIVTGHGNFANGLTSAVEIVLGAQEAYVEVNFPKGDTATELEANMGKGINELQSCEYIIVFADLLSGSPFNAAIMKVMKDDRIKVVYGVNFGMLVEAVMNRNMGMDLEGIVANAIETGKNQIGVFQADAVQDDDDDEL